MITTFCLYLPKIEFKRLKKINFFPTKPVSLKNRQSICIGSKTRTIGDALLLSTLPVKLKKKFPHLKITVYPRGFNPTVFLGNPFISGIQYLPEEVFGDDINIGKGHLTQIKERFFDLPISDHVKPEIHLLDCEKTWIKNYLRKNFSFNRTNKPLCVIHPRGHTWKSVAPRTLWSGLTHRWRDEFYFLQVGLRGDERVPGCDHHFLLPRAFRHARKLFALMNEADCFIGVNSGPMHAARAFSIPSLIVTEQGDFQSIMKLRLKAPYFLYHNWENGFLYEGNRHINIPDLSPGEVDSELDQFLNSFLTGVEKKTRSV